MLDEIERAAKAAETAGIYEGTVTKTATDEDEGLMVRVHAFGSARGRDSYGPLPWMPRYDVGSDTVDIVFPVKGDRVWVAFDEEGEGVVLAHWPFS